MKHVVLFSGGVDSVCTLMCLRLARTIYYDVGYEYAAQEIEAARETLKVLEEITQYSYELEVRNLDLTSISRGGENAFIPYRNALIALHAAAEFVGEGEPTLLWMGGLRDDNVADKSPEAFKLVTDVIRATGPANVVLHSPFWEMSKAEVVAAMTDETKPMYHRVSRDEFQRVMRVSSSCYKGTNCGDCPSCFRKAVALKVNGYVLDMFETDPLRSETAQRYRGKIQGPEYEEARRRDTLRALGEAE